MLVLLLLAMLFLDERAPPAPPKAGGSSPDCVMMSYGACVVAPIRVKLRIRLLTNQIRFSRLVEPDPPLIFKEKHGGVGGVSTRGQTAPKWLGL